MYSKTKPPQRVISSDAVKVWRMTEIISDLIILAVLSLLYVLCYYFDWKEWIGWILIGLAALTVIAAIWGIVFGPKLKQKYWRYDVNEEFIQIKHGVWNEVHVLVPMTKVQSVELNQGPFLRKYELYSISVGTMGTTHEIPAVPKDEAYELRDQIAYYAKIKEVE
ncbi:PH domain-containing protein [Bacillus sp. FJAT-52991]|uniref:PH domain-containing protein n=1 Tax=Bacillus kandeliae TaxID=3129297 RepID=A0ABZ2N7A9_9BACI